MNVACSNCPAKYGVPDDKVRGRKVRITCKRCGSPIVIDGTVEPRPSAAPAPTANKPSRRQQTLLGGLDAPPGSAPGAARRVAGGAFPAAGGLAGSAAPKPAVREPAPAPEPPPEPWTVAVTEEDQREMTTPEVVGAFQSGLINDETFIWRDGMEDWLTAFEIPEIAAALKARGIQPPPDDDAGLGPLGRDLGATPERSPRPASGWHEPGRWDAPGSGSTPRADLSFDDVTVAMAAPKAQELLDAVAFDTGRGAEAPAVEESPASPPAGLAPLSPASSSEDAPTSAPPSSASPSSRAAPLFDDDESTVVADSSRYKLPWETEEKAAAAADAPSAANAGDASPEDEADAASARPASSRGGHDLFGNIEQAGSEEEQAAPRSRMPSYAGEGRDGAPTGARNESSVLFSLDALAKKAEPKAPEPMKSDAAAALLLGSAPSHRPPNSIANLNAGFGSPAADLSAPAAPSQPPQPPQASTEAMLASLAPPPRKEGGRGLLGVLGVLLVLGAVGGALYAAGLHKKWLTPEAPSAAPPQGAVTPTPAPESTTATDTTAEAPEGTTSGAAAASAPSAEPAAPSPDTTPSSAAGTTEQPAAGDPKAAATPAARSPAQADRGEPSTPASTTAAEEAAAAPFSRDAAASALSSAAAEAAGSCADGTKGAGKVTVTFVNSGRATRALVDGDLAGTSAGGCVARVFRNAKVPAFSGDSVTVSKTVTLK